MVKVADLLRLDGRVAVITGGYAWLGNDMARALAEYGASIIITSCDKKKSIPFFPTRQVPTLGAYPPYRLSRRTYRTKATASTGRIHSSPPRVKPPRYLAIFPYEIFAP